MSLSRWWPGLAALWMRGSWGGLLTAVGFAILLNLALLATFGPNLISTARPTWLMPFAAWVLVLGFWVLATWSSRNSAAQPDSRLDEWFQAAQSQYLKGHWIEVEATLGKVLGQRPEDVEARLLLASVWARTGRRGEAMRLLTELSNDVLGARWRWEIHSQMSRVAEEDEPRTLPQQKAA